MSRTTSRPRRLSGGSAADLRKALLAGAALLAVATTAAAQVPVNYNDGDVSSAPIVVDGVMGTNLIVVVGTAEQSGVISGGPHALLKTGAGTLILSGANTYTFQTDIYEGTLVAGNDAAFSNSIVNLALAGATLGYLDGITINNTIGIVVFGGAVNFDVASGRATQAGEITSPFADDLIKTGAGTLVLAAANPFLGASLRIDAGTIEVGNAGALGGPIGATALILNGGGLRSTVSATFANSFVFNPGTTGTVSAAAGQTITFGPAGGGSIALFGAGSTAIFGSATDSGTVVIASNTVIVDPGAMLQVAGGTLRDGNGLFGGQLFNFASVTVNSGATLDLNGFSAGINNLLGAGTVQTGINPLSVLALQGGDFAGAITGAGAVRQLAGGTTILSGANSYSGGTAIDLGGTLQLGTLTSAGSITGLVTNDGTFNIVNGNTNGLTINTTGEMNFYNATSAGNATITTIAFGGLVTFRDNSTAGTATIINNSGLEFTDSSTAGAATITNSGDLLFSQQARAGTAVITNGTGGVLYFGSTILGGTDTASADHATIVNTAGGLTFFGGFATAGNATITSQSGSAVFFGESSTAGSATITNQADAATFFSDSSTAGNATIINEAAVGPAYALLVFDGSSTAGNATIITRNGSEVLFGGNSTGGNARFITEAGGLVDFGFSFGPNNDGRLSAGSIEGAGDYFLGSNQLTVGSNNRSTEVSGVIADSCGCGPGGGSLVKVGTGTLTLSGANTYTGPTIVEAGTLTVNGSLVSAVTVNAGAWLSGVGTIGALDLSGNLAPGNSIGTMTVAGNATFNAGSVTFIELSGTTADRVNIGGTATLAGGLRVVLAGSGFNFTTTYTVLSATGGRTGTFTDLSSTLPAITPHLTYTATDVQLRLSAGALVPLLPGLPTNPANVAAALDRAVAGGADVSAFMPLYLLPLSSLQQALAGLSGETGTGTQDVALRASSLFLNLMLDPMAGARGAQASSASPSLIQMADPPVGRPLSAGRVSEGWAIWTKAFGQATKINADAGTGAAATNSGIYGVAAGADRRISPETLVGFALAGGGTSYGLGARGGGTGDLFQIGLYGSTRLGNAYVSAAVAYGWNSFDIKRNVNLAGPELYRSSVTAQTYGGRIEAGWRFGQPGFGWTPYAALEAIGYSAPRYSESSIPAGGVFGLNFAGKSAAWVRTELGVRLDGRMVLSPGTDLIAFGRLAWAYQPTTERSLDAQFQTLGNSGFTVFGARPSMHTALASAGAELRLGTGLSFTSSIEAELGERHQAIRGSLGLRHTW
ncbi:autotransporter domain-containing protein [Phreatobacter stygius]|uniref:Autotransporter domain-containing protein n=1 Tax=Phreatobacter stygius TaxID=1940610 RepID=A0A4D7B4A4_9HYPH|nr:autotransporter domain-containing protein [Phreatobacter stygius]QCI67761.1 autotransporter domain-containing protein [Phreatobacter stygius]